jgi:glycolate oxidase FAD binding subunit
VDHGADGARVSTQTIAERVREAAANRTPLQIAGARTWCDAGPAALSLAGERGIVEYTPGDLTLTARAGTSLAEIARATGAEGQWLTLDPHGTDEGTIGATVSTASWGPLAHAYGTPRDLVLGLEAVTGDGTIIRTGGRVVKNVAGFDLTRLLTGSWGTLAILTEVTLRLRARPEEEDTIVMAVRDDAPGPLEEFLGKVRGASAAPLALELLSPAMAVRVGAGAGTVLLARLGGNVESVRAQRAALAAIATVTSVGADIWRTMRASEPEVAAVIRIAARPSLLADNWRNVRLASERWPGAYAHASVGRGVVRWVLPKIDADPVITFNASGPPNPPVTERVGRGPVPYVEKREFLAELTRRARNAFDPHGILQREVA